MYCTDIEQTDGMTAPKTYHDLVRTYGADIISWVRQAGIDTSSVEDVAQDVLVRLIQADILRRYDPTLKFLYKGEMRPARFKTFLSKTVFAHLRGFVDRERKRTAREMLTIDTHATDEGTTANGWNSWVEFHGPKVESPEDTVIDQLDHDADRAEIRRYLGSIPRRTPTDHLDMPRFYDAMNRHIDAYGELIGAQLMAEFGISLTTVHEWKQIVREHEWRYRVHVFGQHDLTFPTRRPRTTKAKNQLGG